MNTVTYANTNDSLEVEGADVVLLLLDKTKLDYYLSKELTRVYLNPLSYLR